MKDFPLNDLLSATELDKIRQALVAIFTHLKKIRNTKYPIQRALRLVEAISRDLSSQLLKVLGTRKLMHVAYEEFEKVRLVCVRVGLLMWENTNLSLFREMPGPCWKPYCFPPNKSLRGCCKVA